MTTENQNRLLGGEQKMVKQMFANIKNAMYLHSNFFWISGLATAVSASSIVSMLSTLSMVVMKMMLMVVMEAATLLIPSLQESLSFKSSEAMA